MVQAVESGRDGVLLYRTSQARTQRLARHARHDNQRLICVKVSLDGLRSKSGRVDGRQSKRTPLAQRLIAVKPALITDNEGPVALERSLALDGNAVR